MSTAAKHIRVAVLAHDGTLLGYVSRKPTNANWRNLGKLPRVTLNSHAKEFPRTRECDRRWVDSGRTTGWEWAVFLHEGEQPPPNMEAP